VYETLGDFREKNIMFIIKCLNKEIFKIEVLETISKQADMIYKKYIEIHKISTVENETEEHKVCIGFVSGAMIYIMSIKDIELDNNL
jgi:hypothetical protein